ncbi:hypothetical protein [Ramlibacter pallidus]|uniref:Restriction endonuclease subunit S n=1 Tax=Ramlibacter pallidus TaxID=2780087 RepID=A0ABR9S920_9BURK|nr:hypothetical protein [Ramlibacter pallidus]MBE7370033.1 hypothetical protein [Ramlibacter pallidus]
MTMAVWSILEAPNLGKAERWDAEFFSPSNLALSAQLGRHNPVRIDTFADVTDGIHASPEWVNEGGVAYLSAKCVREHAIDPTGAGRISKTQDAANPRTRARKGDVIITSVGTIGNAAVVEDWMLPANMDRHLAIIRIRDPKEIDPYYLATFLNSEFGRFQSIRESTGNVQLNLFIDKIKGMRVPVARRFQALSQDVQEACAELRTAKSYYPEAQEELLARLGWVHLQRAPELTYLCSFSTLEGARRHDAEFFHPSARRFALQIAQKGGARIRDFCKRPNRGVQPSLTEDGDVLVIDSKAVRPQGVQPAPGERATRAFYDAVPNAKARVKRNDVLLNSTGRGTLGRAACYHFKDPAICDNHVAILRPDPAVCLPDYLALFLNSPPGIQQSEQFQTGSSGQLEIYPEHIEEFLVFLPKKKDGGIDLEWQEKLASKVQQSTKAQAHAKKRLDSAKRALEARLRQS